MGASGIVDSITSILCITQMIEFQLPTSVHRFKVLNSLHMVWTQAEILQVLTYGLHFAISIMFSSTFCHTGHSAVDTKGSKLLSHNSW